MAESIKTVGLNKTYDNFQAWEDDADGNSTTGTPWWAEFYSGADLGALVIAGWSDPPTAEAHRIKLYVASGHQHNGISGGATSSATASADLISISMSFVTLDGLHADQNSTSGNYYAINMATGAAVEGTTVERCLIKSSDAYCVFGYGKAGAVFNVRNNIMIKDGESNELPVCRLIGLSTYPVYNVYHNVFTGAGVAQYGLQTNTAKGSLDLVAENNISFDNDDGDYALAGTSITANNNISSDATADDDGGSGNLIDQTDTDILTDPSNDDFRLKSTSAAIGAGVTIASVTTDILGTSRPKGGSYDIGPYEYTVAGPLMDSPSIASVISQGMIT